MYALSIGNRCGQNRYAPTVIKLLLVMKLTIVLIVLSLFQVTAATRAQNVTVRVDNTALEDVFKLLEKQTGYHFLFNSAMIEKAESVSINVKNKPLRGVLDDFLSRQSLSYIIEDQTVIITEKPTEKTTSQRAVVTGIVTDSKGETLPGVSVKVKGGSASTVTDAKGNFRINADENATLVFSYVGFKTQEVAIKGRTSVSVKLLDEVSSLNEVVVIGYGAVKKRDLTGAVASVKAEDIALNPVSNPVEALQGRVAGLDIQRESGRTGSAPVVALRGDRSISGGGEPLYIIDGLIGNPNNLNPNDIESISVLKDASATAIYGVMGANGVMIITTKKAVAGKIQVDVNSYYGINGFASFPEPLMGERWLSYMKDRYVAVQGAEPTKREDYLTAPQIALIDQGKWVNWVDETMKTGVQQNHYASIRGGTDKTQAYLSLGYIGEKGIYENDEAKNLNARAGVDMTFNKYLKAGIQTIFSARNNDQTNSRINQAYSIIPLGDVYNPDGTINIRPLGANTSNISPIANYQPGVWVDNDKILGLNLNPYIEITPVKNLSIRSNFGGRLGTTRGGQFQNERSFNLAAEGRNTKIATYETANSYGYSWETFATYNLKFKKDHNFSAMALLSMHSWKDESSFITGEGFDYDDYLYYNMGAARTTTSTGSLYSERALLSTGGRFNYSYKGKYLLTATIRHDGASQLVKHWDTFPSFALGWRISDEGFMKGASSWLNNLKLRASYGITGNNDILPYQGQTEVISRRTAANLSLGGSAILPVYTLKQSLANPDLRWERSKQTNLGIDVSVLKNRIDFTADYYYTNTDGVHYTRSMPSTSGGFDGKNLYTKALNIAETENRGIELTLSSQNIVKKNFRWNSALTFTAAREKLLSIDLGNGQAATQLISANLFPGEPLSTIYGYKKVGIWQLGEETEAAKYGAKPGDIKLATVPRTGADGNSDNGVHTYSAADRMIIGNRTPDWTLGFQNTFAYKGLDLIIFVHARYGQTLNAPILGYWDRVAQPAFYDYWMPTNPTNEYPRPGSTFSNNFVSALNYVDGSYLKIKNVTLGYTIPTNLAKKIAMSRLRIYGTAYNPLIFAKSKLLKEVDPETGGTDSFPLFKQIVFGVNVSF